MKYRLNFDRFVKFFSLVSIALGLSAFANVYAETKPKFTELLATPELLHQVREAKGVVMYMRHSMTDNSRLDRVPSVDLNDCNTQRLLSDEGRVLATQVGEYMRQAAIPHDIPIVSPMCRAKETAQLAFGDIETDIGLSYSGSLTSAEKLPVIARTRELLSMPVQGGHNRLLVAHAPNLMDTMGYFPKECTIVFLKPEGNGQFSYLGSVPPTHWEKLLVK
jgi:phosphohistidine phosphatase SixA